MLIRVIHTDAVLSPNERFKPIVTETPEAFIDWLGELRGAAWLSVGERALVRGRDCGAYSTAWALMEAVIADQQLVVDAWNVRDGVETAAYLAALRLRRMSRRERQVFAAAHRAAEDVALALLVQGWLPRPEFDVVVRGWFGARPESGAVGTS